MSDSMDSTTLSLIPLPDLKARFDSKFGKGVWSSWEPETFSLELNLAFTPLLVDKISLLRIIEVSPLQVFEDPALFLYAAEVINNNPADFRMVPHLTILEAAYAIHCIKAILVSNGVTLNFPEALKKAMAYLLNQEGASEPIPPFEFVDPTDLSPGQTKSDTEAKKKAIEMYISYMDSL